MSYQTSVDLCDVKFHVEYNTAEDEKGCQFVDELLSVSIGDEIFDFSNLAYVQAGKLKSFEETIVDIIDEQIKGHVKGL